MTDAGRTAFDGYAAKAAGLNFMGEPIPAWDDLPEGIREAWRAAAAAVAGAAAGDIAVQMVANVAAMKVTAGDLDVIASCLYPGCWRQFRGDAAADAMARWYEHLTPDHPGWDE
jgi:hypothetical protein